MYTTTEEGSWTHCWVRGQCAHVIDQHHLRDIPKHPYLNLFTFYKFLKPLCFLQTKANISSFSDKLLKLRTQCVHDKVRAKWHFISKLPSQPNLNTSSNMLNFFSFDRSIVNYSCGGNSFIHLLSCHPAIVMRVLTTKLKFKQSHLKEMLIFWCSSTEPAR